MCDPCLRHTAVIYENKLQYLYCFSPTNSDTSTGDEI